MRIGMGFDVHRFAPDRGLVLGGVLLPYNQGLDGWSDADVLVHAVMDALLGAAALGDIGKHFPPGEAEFQGASSLELLGRVRKLLSDEGYTCVNLDATIAMEEPKVAPYLTEIRRNLAQAIGIQFGAVSVKATTTEGLGFIGRQEGAAAWAVVLIRAAG